MDKVGDLKKREFRWRKSDIYQRMYRGETPPEIGTSMSVDPDLNRKGHNSFEYDNTTHKVHFFKDHKMAKNAVFFDNPEMPCCICVADIPTEVLEKYKGFGRYLRSAIEYAIPIDEFDPSWIMRIVKNPRELDDETRDLGF